jgi:hypothetical protein
MNARKKPKKEHATQNDIRNALCDEGLFFRANVGTAWASNDIAKLADGSLVLRNPRPFSTGLPAGFHDVFGFVPTVITPDMVGQTVAIIATVECKSSTGKAREAQERFAKAVKAAGGRTGFARDVPTALRIVRGE